MADRYWVGGSGTWSAASTANWSTSSGGASGASVPTAADNVIFDLNSGGGASYSVSLGLTGNQVCKDITITQPTGGDVTFSGALPLTVSGSWSCYSGCILSATFFTLVFNGAGTHTTQFNGVALRNVDFSGTGTYTLLDAITTDGNTGVSHSNGTLNLGGFAVNTKSFNSTGATARTLNLSSSTITLTANDGTVPWNMTGSNLTLNAGTSTIKINSTNADAADRTFNGLSKTYNIVWFSGSNTSAAFKITGSNTFSELKEDFSTARTILFTNGTTQTITTWSISGTSGNVITLQSTTAASAFNLVKSGVGKVNVDYLSIKDSAASPANTWYAGTHSTNVSGNTGWIFTAAPMGASQMLLFF